MSDLPQPITGRTWADTAAEALGQLLKLLGDKFIYLVFFAAIAAVWWFFDQQDQERRALYDANLAKLQEQRDSAFDQLRAFNTDVATISSAQVKTVGDALEQLKSISDEAEDLRKLSYETQREIDERTREAESTRSELNAATEALAAKEAELSAQQKRLGELEARVARQETDLNAKAADLERRSARIGELTDLLRRLERSASATLPAEERLAALRATAERVLHSLPEPEQAMLRDALGEEAQPADVEELQAVLNQLRDRVVDPAQLLRPVADLSQAAPAADVLDQLIGFSLDRLRDEVAAAAGFEFTAWIDVADESYGGMVALAVGEGWFRSVFIEGAIGEDGIPRVNSLRVREDLLPVCGPGVTEAFPARCTIFSSDSLASARLDSFHHSISYVSDADAAGVIPFDRIDTDVVARVIYSGTPDAAGGLPVLRESDLDALAARPDSPEWVRQALAAPDSLPRTVFAVAKALADPYGTAERLVPATGAAELDAAVRGVIVSILEGDDPLLPLGSATTSLAAAAAIAANPRARLRVQPGQRVSAAVAQHIQQQASPAEPGWSETAEATLEIPGETNRRLSFERSSDQPDWRLTGIDFTRASRW